MKSAPPLPRLPYVLLVLMSIVSFGGPFVIFGAVRSGGDPGWPPDRPVEWAVIAVVMALFFLLFSACVSIRLWFRPETNGVAARGSRPLDGREPDTSGAVTSQEPRP